MNKQFTMTLNTKDGSKQAVRFNIDTDQPRKPISIVAPENVRYQITDESTLTAPQNLIFKRNGADLYIAFLDERVDIILENFYNHPLNGIVGVAEDGNFYQYMPESGYAYDYVAYLGDGKASWNALGGLPTKSLYIPPNHSQIPMLKSDENMQVTAQVNTDLNDAVTPLNLSLVITNPNNFEANEIDLLNVPNQNGIQFNQSQNDTNLFNNDNLHSNVNPHLAYDTLSIFIIPLI